MPRSNHQKESEMSDWILQIVSAKMPASCRSHYVVIRVLEVDDGVEHVSTCRAKEVRRIVDQSGAVPAYGTTPRSGRQQAMAHARSLIARRSAIEAAQNAALIEKRKRIQEVISAKLEAGEALTDKEYALLS